MSGGGDRKIRHPDASEARPKDDDDQDTGIDNQRAHSRPPEAMIDHGLITLIRREGSLAVPPSPTTGRRRRYSGGAMNGFPAVAGWRVPIS